MMARSNRLTLRELSRASEILHDARDVGHDPKAWPAILVEGLSRLVGVRTASLTSVEWAGPGVPGHTYLLADCGWDSAKERQEWYHRFGEMQEFRSCDFINCYSALVGRLTTRSREQLVDDPEWFRSSEYNELYRPLGLSDLLLSFGVVDGGRNQLGFGLDRPIGSRKLGSRERKLVHWFHHGMLRQLDRSLRRVPDPKAGLPPRLARTLDCLLEGDSAGQTALRLGVSLHTANEYIGDLYRRFGVRSRRELMAFCLRSSLPRS
jgi:DNA-binding CsgD family transcriptional regulator